MQVDLDVCTHSRRLMSGHLDIDTHFPGSQRVLRAGGGYINYLRGAFNQKHASSTINRGNGIMNTVTPNHTVTQIRGQPAAIPAPSPLRIMPPFLARNMSAIFSLVDY